MVLGFLPFQERLRWEYDLRTNCCAELNEQAVERTYTAPDLTIPLTSASYLGSKAYNEPSGLEGFFDTWASIARAAKDSQPHWITPLATVTPRLEQEVRYDQFFEHTNTGADVDVYDGGKGLEIIPTMTNEVLIACRLMITAPSLNRRTDGVIGPRSPSSNG